MNTLYTIGHSNYETEKFIELLKINNINVVVDVRSVSYSQYTTQFNREHIKASLKENGIHYNKKVQVMECCKHFKRFNGGH